MIERAKFHKIVRNSNESRKEFNLRVCQQGAQCEFKNHLEEQLRDRLVAGINNPEIERKLLQEPKLTYTKAKEIIMENDRINSVLSSSSQVLQTQYQQSYRQPRSHEHQPFNKFNKKPISTRSNSQFKRTWRQMLISDQAADFEIFPVVNVAKQKT